MALMMGTAVFSLISACIGHNLLFPEKIDTTPVWLACLNFVSAVCGVFCVFLCARRCISNFIFALINTTVYIVYLWYNNIYGTLILETFVYFPVTIISWIYWAKHRDDEETVKTKSRRLTWEQYMISAGAIIGLTVLTHFLLMDILGLTEWGKLTEDYTARMLLTWLDSAVFAIGIIAVILECLRYREQYVWWIITDIIAVTLYAIKVPFDPVYFVKKAIYLIVAIIGLKEWMRGADRNVSNE